MSEKHFPIQSITVETALELVEAGLRIGAEHGVKAYVAVVDPAMNLVAVARADGATPHSQETSIRKAVTAASTRKPSGSWEGDFAAQAPLATGLRLTNIRGGLPICYGGVHVGGLGIAGGAQDVDSQIAIAVLAAVGADPV